MSRYKIAWLPGDGIGIEVLQAARVVLDKLNLDADYLHGDIGWNCWCQEGDPFPKRTIELLEKVDAAMFGAITSKPTREANKELSLEHSEKIGTYRSPIVKMRQLFDLYICLRPCKAFPNNPLNTRENINLTVFRENTEDLYSGVEFFPVPNKLSKLLSEISPSYSPFFNLNKNDFAISCKINTRRSSERIIRAAFEFARNEGRKKVTVVHKANVVRATDGLFLESARIIARHYPEIVWDDANVDAITMWLLKNPLNYDVLVAPNLFGDIISDLCAQMVGGLGFGCSGNIGDRLAVFEPTHGSAPKYAGQYKVNPIATVMASKMMLDWLGETKKSQRIEGAVVEIIKEGKIRTYDMGGTNTTMEMAQAIADKL